MFSRKLAALFVVSLLLLTSAQTRADSGERSEGEWQPDRTLGIHFTVANDQPSTTITSASVTLWCNSTCTNPPQNDAAIHGSGFSVGPGSYTYVCTTNGARCFPAGNLELVCGGTGSIVLVNQYANSNTFMSQCLPVSLSSNTMVTSAGTQTMTTN